MHAKEAANATSDDILRDILDVVTALRNGHLTGHMNELFPGIAGEIAKTINDHLEMLRDFKREHHRLMEEIGVTGRLGGQMAVDNIGGAWKEMLDDVNKLGVNVTCQYRDGGNVTRSLLSGDLSARMTCRMIGGEFREFREKFNELAERYEKAGSPAST